MSDRIYMCSDLKSFYASVECLERSLNPLVDCLVVADIERTEKTICLAATPALKSFKVPSRSRLFEVNQIVNQINNEKLHQNNIKEFTSSTHNIEEFKKNPLAKLSIIVAKPQMAKYIEVSTKIYNVYLKFVSEEDIHVYSIDEVFMDVTKYLKSFKETYQQLASKIAKSIFKETGITTTIGVGTNLYLAKIAMDIGAKKITNEEKIAYLDEKKYREKLWDYTPLSDFWRIGKKIAKRLEALKLYTMGDIARCSLGKEDEYYNSELLYKEFGINAELLIDHAWGYEPVTLKEIKEYKPKENSISSGQVLSYGYDSQKALIVVMEMMELLSLDLVKKNLLTKQIVLTIGYDIENLTDPKIKKNYHGEIKVDSFNRKIPKEAHGTINLDYTSSTILLTKAVRDLYNRIINPNLLVRRISIGVNQLIDVDTFNKGYVQLNLFSEDDKVLKKEKSLQKAILDIKEKYGKNSILKAFNLEEGATTKERNEQIGGHKS